jgi:hypothetical protein
VGEGLADARLIFRRAPIRVGAGFKARLGDPVQLLTVFDPGGFRQKAVLAVNPFLDFV